MAIKRPRPKKKDYENYVCPYCFNQLNKCTCELYPPWELVLIDLNMQPIIRLLNNKGYLTASCCESHYDGNRNVYVSFRNDYNFNPPEPFKYKSEKDKAVEYYIKVKDQREFEAEKARCLSSLLTWAAELPIVGEKPRRL